jgi:hypothetical protein
LVPAESIRGDQTVGPENPFRQLRGGTDSLRWAPRTASISWASGIDFSKYSTPVAIRLESLTALEWLFEQHDLHLSLAKEVSVMQTAKVSQQTGWHLRSL